MEEFHTGCERTKKDFLKQRCHFLQVGFVYIKLEVEMLRECTLFNSNWDAGTSGDYREHKRSCFMFPVDFLIF